MCSRPRASRFMWKLIFKNAVILVQKPWAGNLFNFFEASWASLRMRWEDSLRPWVAEWVSSAPESQVVKKDTDFSYARIKHWVRNCENFHLSKSKWKLYLARRRRELSTSKLIALLRGRAKSSFSLESYFQSSVLLMWWEHPAEWDVFPAQSF